MLDMQPQPAETTNDIARKEEGRRRRLANLKPIQKGEVRNPTGRPKKDLNLAKLAQQHAEQAVLTLAKCLTDDEATWPAKVSAAAELLDRGFGRAPQSIDMNHKFSLSDEFEAFLKDMRAQKEQKILTVEAVPVAIENERSSGSQEIPTGHFRSPTE